jgi:putative tryptophan/tyrosine transport system substrate-binding protein
LTARDRIPAAYPDRALSRPGADERRRATFFEMYRQVGVYAGTILKGTKPVDLPVQQSTKFEFVINRGTAKVLRLGIPVMLRACAGELID